MRRTQLLGPLAAVSLVVALAACGGTDDPTGEEVQDDLTEQLLEYDADLTDDQAECIAGALVQAVGESKAADDAADAEEAGEEPEDLTDEEVLDLGASELSDVDFSADEPEELEDEVATAAVVARDECLGGDVAAE